MYKNKRKLKDEHFSFIQKNDLEWRRPIRAHNLKANLICHTSTCTIKNLQLNLATNYARLLGFSADLMFVVNVQQLKPLWRETYVVNWIHNLLFRRFWRQWQHQQEVVTVNPKLKSIAKDGYRGPVISGDLNPPPTYKWDQESVSAFHSNQITSTWCQTWHEHSVFAARTVVILTGLEQQL